MLLLITDMIIAARTSKEAEAQSQREKLNIYVFSCHFVS